MRTLDEQTSRSASKLGSLSRDVRLVRRLFGMAWAYFTRGVWVRRRYRQKERRGEIYWVDDVEP